VNVEKLNWDSNFFETEVYKVTDINSAEEVSKLKIGLTVGQLAYIFSPEEIKYVDLNLVDEKVLYALSLPLQASNLKSIKSTSSVGIKTFTGNVPCNMLRKLAIQSGKYSRFFVDKKCPVEKAESLYNIWIERSVSGEIASEVLVAVQESNVIGMITLKLKDNVGDIGLIAVDTNKRGLGIGKSLLINAIDYFRKNGIDKVTVVTQGRNIAACKTYESLGFKVANKEYIYHYWK
jgi:dTDP-4-amino-4,6-dideoxy-D-galactose acyltransferase